MKIINPEYLRRLHDLWESKWFSTLVAIAAFLFIGYKSIYQSDSHLNDLFSLLILLVLFSLVSLYEHKWGVFITAILLCLLFAAPLYWLWRSGRYDTSVIAGMLPIGDPLQYYGDALRLQYGYRFSMFSSQRPLFIGFLSLILALTFDNLQLTLIVFLILVILSMFFLLGELKKAFGVTASATVIIILYYCYKGHGYIGRTLTEQLGLLFGALALALFLKGIRLREDRFFLLGLLVLTLGLNARAGAFIVLPALIIWKSTFTPNARFSIRKFMLFSGISLLGFMLNLLVLKAVANSQRIPFDDFGETLYGLVTGYRGWSALYVDHPGIYGLQAWPLIVESLRQHPGLFLVGIIRAYLDFFTPQTMFQFLYFSPDNQTITSYFLFACGVAGVLRTIRRSDVYKPFILMSNLGILLSVPFAPPSDEGIRALTATMPFFALLPAMAFSMKSVNRDDSAAQRIETIILTSFTWITLVSVIGGPMLVRFSGSPPPPVSRITCPSEMTPISIHVSSGSFVRLVSNDWGSYSFLPNLRVKDVRLAIKNNPFDYFNKGSTLLRNLQAGNTILVGFNIYTLTQNADEPLIWLIVPTNQITENTVNYYCAKLTVIDGFGNTKIFSAEASNITP